MSEDTTMGSFETIIGPFISRITISRPERATILSDPNHRHTLIIHCDNPAYMQHRHLFFDFDPTSSQVDDAYTQDHIQLGRASELERSTLFLERLKEIVLVDGMRYPAIDAVHLVDAHGSEGPLLSALEGLKPKHLTVHCSTTGYVNLSALAKLEPKWPLESLALHDASQAEIRLPKLDTIHTLALKRCQDFPYQSISRSISSVKHLSIRECSGGSLFERMCSRDRGLAERLETLELESPQLDYFEEVDLHPYSFKRRLSKCTNLRSLTLILADTWFTFETKCMGLPAFLPDNLVHLEIHGPPAMASDLWFWQQYVEDPQWLTKLEAIKLRFRNVERRGMAGGEEIEDAQDVVAALETKDFLNVLVERRSEIRIL